MVLLFLASSLLPRKIYILPLVLLSFTHTTDCWWLHVYQICLSKETKSGWLCENQSLSSVSQYKITNLWLKIQTILQLKDFFFRHENIFQDKAGTSSLLLVIFNLICTITIYFNFIYKNQWLIKVSQNSFKHLHFDVSL